MWEFALKRLREGDSFAAIEFLNAEADPRVALEAYAKLVGHLYWQDKDVFRALALGTAAISLAHARAGEGDVALHLKSSAKTMAYNLASFSWPGWDEPGIALDGTTAAIGLEAARCNLRLAQELAKGDLPLARAHWMLGAHQLAARDFTEAAAHFGTSADLAARDGSRAEELMAAGYGALTRCIQGEDGARARLDELKSELAPLPDGPFFVEQLVTAERVFGGRG